MRVFALIPVLAALVAGPAPANQPSAMTVWKSPTCGCCASWIGRMRAQGFRVTVRDRTDLRAIKRMAGIPEPMQSCHTARIEGYTIEGHVPAADIRRLLAQRPRALGLAVPGMPSGSPGMENGMRDPYRVLLLGNDGSVRVHSTHR